MNSSDLLPEQEAVRHPRHVIADHPAQAIPFCPGSCLCGNLARLSKEAPKQPLDLLASMLHVREHPLGAIESIPQEGQQLIALHQHPVAVADPRPTAGAGIGQCGVAGRHQILEQERNHLTQDALAGAIDTALACGLPQRKLSCLGVVHQVGAQGIVQVVAQVGDLITLVDEVGFQWRLLAGQQIVTDRKALGDATLTYA